MFRKLVIIFSLLLFSLLISCGNSDQIVIKDVKVIHSSNSSLAAILKRKDWKTADKQLYIKKKISLENYTATWIKGDFFINKDISQYTGIFLRNDTMTDTVYLNRQLVGRKIIKKISELNKPSLYVIPSGLLKKGKNTVLIYAGIPPMTYVDLKSHILILKKSDARSMEFRNEMLYTYTPVVVVVVFSLFIIFELINYFIDRRTRVRLIFISGLLYTIVVFSVGFFLDLADVKTINIEVMVSFSSHVCLWGISIFSMLYRPSMVSSFPM